MAEPSNSTAAEPASSSTTCAHAAGRLPTEPPGLAKGPRAHLFPPSLPYLPSLKLINSCPNPPGGAGLLQLALSALRAQPLAGGWWGGGGRADVAGWRAHIGPRELTPDGCARCRLFPTARLVQPGPVGAEKRMRGGSHQLQDLHPTRSRGGTEAGCRWDGAGTGQHRGRAEGLLP